MKRRGYGEAGPRGGGATGRLRLPLIHRRAAAEVAPGDSVGTSL